MRGLLQVQAGDRHGCYAERDCATIEEAIAIAHALYADAKAKRCECACFVMRPDDCDLGFDGLTDDERDAWGEAMS
jgi:hypothetical protein